MDATPPDPKRAENRSNMQALIKAEKLTQIAFVIPITLAVGWLLGGVLDKVLHQHWIYLAGIVLGIVSGFLQIFRMIAEPGLLASTAYDPSAAPGPGYQDLPEADRDRTKP